MSDKTSAWIVPGAHVRHSVTGATGTVERVLGLCVYVALDGGEGEWWAIRMCEDP